jgi:phage terminase large subunit-like protein
MRVVGKYERLCAERHARDLELASRPGGHPRGLRFDKSLGERVVTFIERYCKHHKGEWAGKPLLLEQWQKDILEQAFGWLRTDGSRRFRTLYIEVPRKNGKSELASALGLYLQLADGEAGAEVYSSATKKDQARIVWKTAEQMVKKSPDLKRYIKAYQSSLVVEKTGSTFQPLSAESKTLDGLNPHGNIVDELHAHKDRGVWDVLDTAMGARRQPMTVAITTAGTYDAESIGWQTHDYATKVLEGLFDDDSFFAFIAAADESDGEGGGYFTVETQQKANPNYAISIKPEYLAKQAEKAQRQPSFMNEYLRLHLNVWTQQLTRWIPIEKWNQNEQPVTTDEETRELCLTREAALVSSVGYGGLDLSSKLDLTAFALAIPGNDDEINLLMRFWLPEERALECEKEGKRHYATWARNGWLTLTPGNVIDYEFIRKEINTLNERFIIKECAFDPWNAIDLATRLGSDGVNMVECRQGYKSMTEPSKDLEARVIQGKVRHGHNPILKWCIANAVVTSDAAGNIKPDKEKATGKIDGVVAVIMAMSRLIVDSENAYKDRGFLSL